MIIDSTTSYPNDKQTLGGYLGPVIDVGSSMCYNILKANVNVTCQTTVRPLTLKELVDPGHIKMCDEFNTQINARLCAALT